MGVKVKAETFYLEEMPINNLNLRIEETKKYNATITQYLTAVLIYVIYNENY